MKNIRGGYANLDLKSLDLKTERTVAGIFDEVKTYVEDVNKPLIVHNMVYDDELQNDTYVTDVKVSADNIKLYCSGLEITVTNANKIKAVVAESGGSADIAKLAMPITIEQLEDLDLSNPVMVIDEDYPDEPYGLGYVNKRTVESVDYYTISIIYVNHIRTYHIDSSEETLTYEDHQDFQTVWLPITQEKLSLLDPTKAVKVMSLTGSLMGYGIFSVQTIEPTPGTEVDVYILRVLTGYGVTTYTSNSELETVTTTYIPFNNTAITWGRGIQSTTPYEISVDLSASNIATVLFKYLDSESQEVTTAYLPADIINSLLGNNTVSSEVIMQVSALVTVNGTPKAFDASVKFVTSPNGIATLMTSGSGYVDDGTYKGIITLVAEDQDNTQNFVIKAVKGTNLN